MSLRGAPAAGGAAPASTLTPAWLAHSLQSLGVPLRGARLCVAYSGGADSTALLAVLARLRRPWRLRLRALHVDHAMVAGSAARARAARRLALALGVPCTVLRRPVRSARGRSPEAEARDVRYAALRAALAADEWLLLAHHADDQLETVLLQLLRGAGPAGLAASPARAGRELRPLLALPRAALRAALAEGGLGWSEDPSNADLRYDRNYLRHEVLPRLLARWPGAARVVGRSARLAAEAAALLAGQADEQLVQAREGRALKAGALRALGTAARRNLLRRWLQWCGLPLPDERVLRELAGPLLAARADAQPQVAWRGARVRRSGALLHAEAVPGAYVDARTAAGAVAGAASAWPAAGLAWRWRSSSRLALPGGGSLELRADPHGPLAAARLPATLRVRPRGGGERLAGARGSRRVKELLRVQGVPAQLRAEVPLLLAGGQLVAVGDAWFAPLVRASALREPAGGARAKVKRAGPVRLRLIWRPPI